jgi:DNA-binding NarL/FixJ family response regulator
VSFKEEARMRVVLADGHADVRWALRLLLTHDLGMQVVGEAADAASLWAQLQEAQPDLLVLDWSLLGAGSSAALERLRLLYPGLQVIAISQRPEVGTQALTAGADAFVCKADAPQQMVTTLRAARARNGAGRADEQTPDEGAG